MRKFSPAMGLADYRWDQRTWTWYWIRSRLEGLHAHTLATIYRDLGGQVEIV